MPDHGHLLILPQRGQDVSKILRRCKKPVADRVVAWLRRHRPAGPRRGKLASLLDVQPNGRRAYRFWQRGGGYDRNIFSAEEAHEKLAYMHNNPVRKGLVEVAADWPWSSCRAWESGIDEPLRIDRDSLPPLELTKPWEF